MREYELVGEEGGVDRRGIGGRGEEEGWGKEGL